jgi:OmpA-OmpF porin, OOP family
MVPLVSARSHAQEPARFFLIYFRWNSTILRPNMLRRILEAARAAQHHRTARVEVAGYTDTSMSDDDSMNISLRMAEVVADELIKQGVKANVIAVSAMGESNLVKPTADGVIEPYNRRVEIRLHQTSNPTKSSVRRKW